MNDLIDFIREIMARTEGNAIGAGEDSCDHNPEETQQPTGRGGKVSQPGDSWLAELLSHWKQHKEISGFRLVREIAIEATGQNSERFKRDLERKGLRCLGQAFWFGILLPNRNMQGITL